MKASALLRAAWARISTPASLCTGALARDKDWHECSPSSPNAAYHCAIGSLLASGRMVGFDVAEGYLTAAAVTLYGDTIVDGDDEGAVPQVNDRLGWEAIKACYQHAIAAAERHDGWAAEVGA